MKAPAVNGEHRTTSRVCSTCSGLGSLPARDRTRRTPRPEKQFPGWRMIGPEPHPDATQAAWLAVRGDEDLTYLLGRWRLFQRHASHRYSTDDVVTAWLAWRVGHSPAMCVDIGCGIGSVLLMTAWLHPAAVCTGVEVQPERHAQAVRSIAYNGVGDRVTAVRGDIRDAAIAAECVGRCDLVTGTPPYFNVTDGALPPHEESSRCLFEYRGGIEEYAQAGARFLSRPQGLFVVCESALGVTRGYTAATGAGLRVIVRLDVVPREGKPVLFCVFVMCAAESAEALRGRFRSEDFTPHGQSPYHAAEDVYVDAPAAASSVSAAAERTTSSSGEGSGDDDAGDEVLRSERAAAGSDHTNRKKAKRVPPVRVHPGSVDGELVVSITVRDAKGVRTREYAKLLREMGKPS